MAGGVEGKKRNELSQAFFPAIKCFKSPRTGIRGQAKFTPHANRYPPPPPPPSPPPSNKGNDWTKGSLSLSASLKRSSLPTRNYETGWNYHLSENRKFPLECRQLSEKRGEGWERNKRKRGEKEREEKRKGMLISSRYTRGGKFFSPESLSLCQPLCIEERVFLSLYFFSNHIGKEDTRWNPFVWFALSSLSLSPFYTYILFFAFSGTAYWTLARRAHAHTHTHRLFQHGEIHLKRTMPRTRRFMKRYR